MNKKTLAELLLTGAFLIIPQTISNSSGNHKDELFSYTSNNSYSTNITPSSSIIDEKDKSTPEKTEKSAALEKAELEICGDNPQSLGLDFFDFYRLVYSDKRDLSNPIGLNNLKRKTEEELKRGLILREELEKKYAILLQQNNIYNSDSVNHKWGTLSSGYQILPPDTYRPWDHEALDIFVKEGSKILAPFNGVVVALGDQWEGTFVNREISKWNHKGLTPKAGNAIIIYNPNDKGYLLLSHFKEGILVKVGDVVKTGQILGYVGHSGSASINGHGEHIHAAYKLRDHEGYLKGIDFSDKVKL